MAETLRFDVIGRGDASDVEKLGAALNDLVGELRRLDRMRAEPRVEVDTRQAERQLRRLDRSLSDSIVNVAALGRALGTIAIPAALVAAAPQIAALGAAAVDAAGALALLPAVGVAAAVAIGTLVVGLQGFGDAMKARGDAEKFAEAIKELSPAARDAAVTIRDLGAAWTAVRLDVQERLFRGVGDAIQRLSDAYLPALQSTLGGVADGYNRAAASAAEFLGEEPTVRKLSTALDQVRQSVVNASGAMRPLTEAFVSLISVGAERLPRLGQAVADVAARFRDWIVAAERSGDLGRWIDEGIAKVAQLGRIVVDVGGTLLNVFEAADTAGAGFLDSLERVTSGMHEWTSSAEGARILAAIFAEIGAAIDAVAPGLSALAAGAARAVAAFTQTGGLRQVAEIIGQIAQAIGSLLPQLGALAGQTLSALGPLAPAIVAAGLAFRRLSVTAALVLTALTPLAGLVSAVLSALGPLAPAILAAVIAFRALSGVAAGVAALGAAVQAAAVHMGVYTGALTGSVAAGTAAATATNTFGRALSAVGRALPIIGAALIALGVAYDHFSADIEGAAERVTAGQQSLSQAIAEQAEIIDRNEIAWLGGKDAAESYAAAQRQVTAEVERQIAAMSPFEQLQARAAMAQATLNDEVARYGPNSRQASDAAAALAAANSRLEAAERGAEQAAAAHNQTLADRVGAVQTALGATLQMEDALARVAEAEKRANDAAREHGEGSAEAAQASRDFATAADQAAQAVGEQARAAAEAQGATNGAAIEAQAYAAALVQTAAAADGPARTALLGYIDGLSNAELGALNASVAASGFATRVETLPSGRTVLIAVDPETGEIIEVQQLVDGLQDKTITINGNAMPAQDALTRVLSLVAAGAESITINGQPMPAQQALQTVLGMITSSSGTVTIGGQSFPAQAVLSSLIASVNSGSGTVTIGGQSFPADAVLRALVGSINTATGTVTLDANAQPVDTAKTQAQQPTDSTHTVNPSIDSLVANLSRAQQPTQNSHTIGSPITDATQGPRGVAERASQNPHTVGSPTTDNTQGARQGAATATTNPHTVGSPTTDNTAGPRGVAEGPTANPHTVGAPVTDNTTGPKQGAATATANPHTVGSPVETGPVDGAKTAAQQPTRSLHTIDADDQPVLDAKTRAEQPTESMHTIDANDDAVRDAKRRAQQPTSSTHTIHVRVVGGGVPRAAGAYTTPRAAGAYAAPMADGGMRSMSAARAEIVPPRQPRIIGDRMRGDEAFIPINGSRRSLAILATAADRMGVGLTPRAMADGGVVAQAVRAAVSGGGRSAGGDGGALLAELRQLNGQLRDLRGDVDHHGDHAATAARLDITNRLLARLGDVRDSATADAQSARTTAELGAF